MSMPGMITNNLPRGRDDLMRRVQDLERKIKVLEGARRLESASVGKGGLTIKDTGSLIVKGGGDISVQDDGTLSVDGSATVGGTLKVTGATEIDGTLLLPAGIIGNAALNAPVSPASWHADSTTFSLSTTMAVKATATVPVPSGFTRALVMAVSQVTARNTTSSQDFLSVGVAIGGSPVAGWAASVDALATASVHPIVTATTAGTALLTGLGSSFTVQARAQSGVAAWSADAYNSANIDAIILFLR